MGTKGATGKRMVRGRREACESRVNGKRAKSGKEREKEAVQAWSRPGRDLDEKEWKPRVQLVQRQQRLGF